MSDPFEKFGKAAAGWLAAAAVRAFKTGTQAMVGMITGLSFFDQIDWPAVASGAAIAALISLLQSAQGIPEVPTGGSPFEVAAAHTPRVPTAALPTWDVPSPAPRHADRDTDGMV